MASFLFLVHVLATDLLQSESSFIRKAHLLQNEEKPPDEEDGAFQASLFSTVEGKSMNIDINRVK